VGIDREAASERMHINKLDDPFQNLAWKRLYFSDTETEWVKREVRVYCPPLVNVIFVRCGLLGTGQVMYDDASLTYAAPRPHGRDHAERESTRGSELRGERRRLGVFATALRRVDCRSRFDRETEWQGLDARRERRRWNRRGARRSLPGNRESQLSASECASPRG
jgi:hypothetical protein